MARGREGILRQYPTRIIGIGFGVVIILMLILAVATLLRLDRIQENIEEITKGHTTHTQLSHRMYHAARERAYLLVKIVHERDPFLADEYTMRFHALSLEFGQARQALLQEDLVPDEVALLEQQRQATETTMPLQAIVLEQVATGDLEQAEAVLVDQVLPAQENVLTAINQIVALQNQEIAEAGNMATRHDRLAYIFLLVGTTLATLLGVRIAFYVHRNMSGLMKRLSGTSEQLRLSLRDLEFQKQALDEHAIVSIADDQGRISYVNDRFCAVSQYSREELIGSDHNIVNSGSHPKAFFHEMWRSIASGQIWHGQVRNRSKNGSYYWVDTTILPVLGDDGRPYQYVSIRTDITAIKEAEALLQFGKEQLEEQVAERTAELHEREAVLKSVTGAAQDAIVMIDHEDRVTFWNAAAERLFGYSQSEVLGQQLHPLIMPAGMKAQHDAAFSHFIATGEGPLLGKTVELSSRRRDGSEFPIELSLSAVQIKGRWCGIGIARDITDRKQAEKALQLLSETDTLTGTANRRKFDAAMQTEINRAQRHATPLTLALLDIDHFKSVNDTYGHQVGDKVLVELSKLVTAHIRSHDFFARWGGEEFAILATHSDCEDTKRFAEKLRLLVAEHAFPGAGLLTISLGLATYQPDESIETLIARADQALYKAKGGGRNRVECL